MLDHTELVGDFGAAEDHRVGPLRRTGQPLEHTDLFGDQLARVVRQQRRDVIDRGLLAVHHAEPVGDESACGADQFDELFSQRQPFPIVLAGFPRIEADVLQQQDIPVGQTLRAGPRIAADYVVGQLHVLPQMLTECGSDRRQRQFQVGLAFGPSQVGGYHHFGAGVCQRLDRGHRRGDTAGIGDDAVVERHVQIGSNQHASTRNALREKVVQVRDRHGYSDLPTSATKSTRRLE